MRKTFLGATVILPALSAGTTLAADLPPLKDPTAPYLAASPVWTGFYAGLSAGYDFGGSNSATVTTWPDFINPAFAPGVIAGGSILQGTASGVLTLNNSGFVGGGQAGYNYQFSNNLVVGVEKEYPGRYGQRLRKRSEGAASAGGVWLCGCLDDDGDGRVSTIWARSAVGSGGSPRQAYSLTPPAVSLTAA